LDFLRTVRTKSLRVEFDQDRPYHVDGEIRTARRLDVDVVPGALRFLAPPDYAVSANKDPDGNGSLGARAIAAQS
jgi:diacylglycerol kinase family enzyme